MDRTRTMARQAWAGSLTAVLFLTGIAGPLLETVRPVEGPVLESHHLPGDCAPGHDHALCTVMDGGFVLPDADLHPAHPLHSGNGTEGAEAASPPPQPHRGLHTPRGPPSP